MGTLEAFEAHRETLVSLAYRMLGSRADAEDVVQDAWLRWQHADEAEVRDARAWLTTTVSRLCLDRLKSARHHREVYTGPWLPEPVVTDEPLDRESISLAFLVLLEQLTPVERAAYLLHHVFDWSHREVAQALGMTDAAVRHAYHRAGQHVAAGRPRFAPSEAEHRRMLEAFGSAVLQGDETRLTELLAEDATLWADGGGKVRGASTRPLHGAAKIVLFLRGLIAHSYLTADQTFEVQRINGWPALVGRSGGRVNAVIAVETDGTRIFAVRNVVNPEKLALVRVN